MHIVCPHCSTSYAVDATRFGTSGRTVRCARCKTVWQAHPEELGRKASRVPELATASASSSIDDEAAWGLSSETADESKAPHVESPSILSSLPNEGDSTETEAAAETMPDVATSDDDIRADMETEAEPPSPQATGRFAALRARASELLAPLARFRPAALPIKVSAPTAAIIAVSMAACLVFWRADIVRHAPQTAAFYALIGMDVNLRQLAFKDVKVTSETFEGRQVLVIQGNITTQGRQVQPVPRLRFIVRDAMGTEIYAWNLLLDQQSLKPGETMPFRSRLASPPAEARQLDVRFYNSRDLPDRGA